MNKVLNKSNEAFEVDNSPMSDDVYYNNGLFNPTLEYKERHLFKGKKLDDGRYLPPLDCFEAEPLKMGKFCNSALYHARKWENLIRTHDETWFYEPFKAIPRNAKYAGTKHRTPEQAIKEYRKCLNESLNGITRNHKMDRPAVDKYNKVIKEFCNRQNFPESYDSVCVKIEKQRGSMVSVDHLLQ